MTAAAPHRSMDRLLTATAAFARLVDDERVAAAWDDPSAVEGYAVGGLVAHVTAGLSWLTALVEDRAPDQNADQDVLSTAGYLRLACTVQDAEVEQVHGEIVADANRRAEKGHAAGVRHLEEATGRLRRVVRSASSDDLIVLRPLVPAAITVGDFARSRLVEVVVHADDVAASCPGLRYDLDPDVAGDVEDALLQTARLVHGDLAVIRGLARGERATGVFPVI